MRHRGIALVLVLTALAGGCSRPVAGSGPTPAAVGTGSAAGPSGEPTTGPSGGPSAGSTAGPTAGPTTGPAAGSTTGPAAGPTGGPAGPGSEPTGGPALGPTAGLTPLPEVGIVGNTSIPWRLVRQVDTVLIAAVSGLACRRVVGAHITETTEAVTIAVLAGPAPPHPCTDLERPPTVVIRLPHPLGSRVVHHAPLTGSSRLRPAGALQR